MLLKANTLDLLGRKLEAATLRGQLTKLEEARGKPEDVRRNRALQLNKEAIALYAQAGKVSGPEKGPAFERAAQKYQEAITQYLFYPTIWSNLRMACSEAATAWSNGDATTQPKEEAALRCALESAWMAWVLRADADPSPDGIKKLKTLYTDRRGLALFLRNDAKRVPQALRLAEEGVREAETLALQDPSADTLFLLADAYYGLGLMREESKREGWEQAIRAAIADAERLRDLEPTNAAHRIWIGQVRTELANRLESRKRPGAASERELARRTCQDALRLATKPGDRSEAQACIDATQTKAAVSR